MSGGFSGIMTRDSPQGERFKTVSVSFPTPPATDVSRPQRKGTSRTLDNSDLHSPSEDLKKGKEGPGGTIQRAPPRDRKMLKFISGIFTKSAAAAPSANTTPPLYPAVERGSSEEEGKASCIRCIWTQNFMTGLIFNLVIFHTFSLLLIFNPTVLHRPNKIKGENNNTEGPLGRIFKQL